MPGILRGFAPQHRFTPGRLAAAVLRIGMFAAALLPVSACAQNPLITGKSITPVGVQQNVGSLPMQMVLSPDGKYAITSDMGFRESLWSIRTSDGVGVSHIEFNNYPPYSSSNGLYYGLAIAANPDGSSTIYAAQGANDSIAIVRLGTDGTLTLTGTIATQKNDFPTGLALDGRGYLYVTNNDPDTFATPCSLAIYNTASGQQVSRYTFSNSYYGTPNFPLAITVRADGIRTYVASQRDGAVYVLDTTNPNAPSLVKSLSTGAHPAALLLNRAQTRLFVANAHSDTVSVVDTAANVIRQTIQLRPQFASGLVGVTPTGLALDSNEQNLFVALSDMNAVAMVDLSARGRKGYIPAGWYPSAVVVTPQNRLLVANAKGTTLRNPNPTYTVYTSSYDPNAYIQNIIEGNVSTLDVPAESQLKQYTKQVLANNAITAHLHNPQNPLEGIGLKAGKIKHIVYIVKENRTYDQVLGDLSQGNGDPSLVLFGPDVTPNQHALAQRFVLLDNFYDCGEVSGDGWPWSTQSMAVEYVIKNLPYNYSGRGRNYDFEGQNNGYLAGGFPATDPYGNTLSDAFPAGMPAIPDVAEAPEGHLWDRVQAAGLSYRNYGFFYSFGVNFGSVRVLPDNYPASAGIQPAGHDLGGISDYDFRRYDNDYPDSDAPNLYYQQTGNPNCLYARTAYGHYNMPSRFSEWNREFQKMLANDPSGNTVPALMTVRFHHDHTQGLTPGKHSPRSEVADNDYSVGQLVDTISKSAIWNNTAIFVIEDDAQDGPDHVDAHRSTCYVISPYIKQSSIDHTFYNTDSVLKTIELLLGLSPMSQYDAIAGPILDWDTAPGNSASYTAALPSVSIISEINPSLNALNRSDPRRRLAALSSRMDFEHPDSAPARLLNEILWKSVKGAQAKMPAPKRSLIASREPEDRSSREEQHPKSGAKTGGVHGDD